MDYKDFETEHFLKDEFFVEWVIRPNKESNHFWSNWLNQYPEKRKEVELSREIIKKIHYKDQFELSSEEYSFMMERILRMGETPSTNQRFGNDRRSWNIVSKVAASVIILLGISLVLYFNQVSVVSAKKEDIIISSSTTYGQKKVISLPDGTKVTLNSGSQLYYPEKFSGEERRVTFSGEAFFEVAHNPEQPFYIETDGLITKVLGTSFNIKSFKEEDEVSVSVVTGKVAVNTNGGQFALLHPNDMGVFNRESNEFDKRTFNKEKLIAWTNGVLIFENEDLKSIFHKLEKWYGVNFMISDDVRLKGKYSGEYKKKSLELVLQGLSFTSNFKYKIENKTITIYAKNS